MHLINLHALYYIALVLVSGLLSHHLLGRAYHIEYGKALMWSKERLEESGLEEMIKDLSSRILDWQPIETHPTNGEHFYVGDFTPGRTGFGWYDDKCVPWQAVVHYWSNPGEEGLYLSSGSDDNPITHATHWAKLQPLGI